VTIDDSFSSEIDGGGHGGFYKAGGLLCLVLLSNPITLFARFLHVFYE